MALTATSGHQERSSQAGAATRVLLVEDGSSAYVLPAVRSLALAGFEVGLASLVTPSRSHPSRWATWSHALPRPSEDLDAFAAAVAEAVASRPYDVVVGSDDVTLLALSAVRDAIGATVLHPELEVLLPAMDKLALADAGSRAGLDVPRTAAATPASVQAVRAPVVVKARWHWVPGAVTDVCRFDVVTCIDAASAAAQVRVIERAGSCAVLQQPVD